MRPVLWRASLRHLAKHPWQLTLAVLGVSLGVAVMVAIDVASGSAQRAFELSSSAVTGATTHSIEGGVGGLDDDLYRQLRRDLGLRAVSPMVESWISPTVQPERTLRLLGIDPFAESAFERSFDPLRSDGIDLGAFLTSPGAALMSAGTAADLGIAPGDLLRIDVGGRIETLRWIDELTSDGDGEAALDDLVLVDIATAQEILELSGRLTRIDLRLAADADPALLQEIESRIPGDAMLLSTDGRSETAAQMTRAFRLNLQSLSLLGLLCGAFLIYNTMTFAVVQRRQLMATLRALGTTRGQLVGLVLGEALLIGLAGVILGELAGWALGRALVHLVTRTINDLYFVVQVRAVTVEPWILVKGAIIGLGATLTAALAPSWEASGTTPRAALSRADLESRAHRAVPLASLLGLALLATGTLLLLLPGSHLLPALAGLFAVLMGLALLAPLATLGLMALLTPVAGRLLGQLGRIATRGVSAALSRTGVAIAALMVALSVTVGVDLMVRSFRTTVADWLEYTLPADLYISVFTTQARRYSGVGSTLPAASFDELASLPEVVGANALRHFTTSLNGEPTRAIAIDLDPMARSVFRLKEGDETSAWEAFEAGDGVIISEPLAYRLGLSAGDTVGLATPDGVESLRVAAVYYDYSTEQGVLFLDRDLYLGLWQDPQLTALSIHAAAGTDLERLKDRVRAVLGPGNRAQIVSNLELRQRSLEVFDRTFVITGVLRSLAVVVAFIGVLSSLMALQLERTRELGVLRACGLTPGQLWRLVTQQTGLMGLAAGLFALPTGVLMATIMVLIINQRSFGWSLQMAISPASLLQAVLVALVAALLAGLYPAWRMAKTSPAAALREE